MDLLKVRLQTHVGSHTSLSSLILRIYKQQGIPGYYSGLSAAVLRQASYSTIRFGVYEEAKKLFRRPDGTVSPLSAIMSGILGGAAGGIVGNPADVANVRMQNDGSLPSHLRRNYKNVFDALIRMVREEGLRSLFNGVIPNVTRGVIMTTSQISVYDIAKDAMVSGLGMSPASTITHIGSSTIAALVSTTTTSPIDVAKTRIMNSSGKEYRNLGHAVATIYKSEGVSALFKGWVPSFFRLAPHSVLLFILLEQLKAVYIRKHSYAV
ncbi:Mitochondrial dicarboxylate transporter [Zancudomyces culisetae]|uniref:Mitochondrial dicarboxylate transporter n=1 Tax=Zancudomyces culisetae TaxID=1213189 RepID=A0A1R1PX90_ZANCU|nr:Mitochondrial dicarboxylate transporter [Zancudomyces culisetae]|eukprot:OMH85600.1 Mitochondrial dicarboxylate transporter [Zancudomyces culisetae]